MKLPIDFYLRADVVEIAKDLLGKTLVTNIDHTYTSGMIVETEAYCGSNDKASHANNGKRTARTEVAFGTGGVAYVYLCYGIHHLFNVVVNKQDKADVVLIRAIEPLEGNETMALRRNMSAEKYQLTAGPGALTQAMGIKTAMTGTSLLGDSIWIEDGGIAVANEKIKTGTRVGVGYAEEDALKPWRFSIRDNPWVSKAK
ncbi:MAG: DNA-3-methyladenine glycosylase [Cyclobacteriaceae bacterium]